MANTGIGKGSPSAYTPTTHPQRITEMGIILKYHQLYSFPYFPCPHYRIVVPAAVVPFLHKGLSCSYERENTAVVAILDVGILKNKENNYIVVNIPIIIDQVLFL